MCLILTHSLGEVRQFVFQSYLRKVDYLAQNYVWEEVLFYSCESVFHSFIHSFIQSVNKIYRLQWNLVIIKVIVRYWPEPPWKSANLVQKKFSKRHISKSSRPILMKFDRNLGYHKKGKSSSILTRIPLIERKPRPIFQNHDLPEVRV